MPCICSSASVLVIPFLVFGFAHLATSWKRPNRAAIRYGLVLLAAGLVTVVSGFVLVRIGGFEVRDPRIRNVGYWFHVVAPLVAVALYVKHRLAGPRIRWEWARRLAIPVVGFVAVMGLLHFQDPRSFGVKGPKEGKQYFFPSEAVTANGKFIPAKTLMMDEYCLECHKDAYEGWFHSAHHFSSFNNKAYLMSVRETRKVSLERDGSTQAARWCAGCHDPVPFFSGEFDDPNYDDVNNPTSQAGITCTVCHAITTVNNTRGNAAYTIEEPQHYPFAFSDNPILKWINNTLVKAKPEMHKKTFLKPIIKSAEFCSTCHKVGLPFALNHYKDFVRGQNHYDTYLLSGVSGHGARSFYYPPVAKSNCNECHMDLMASNDFGARDFDGKGGRQIHNHLFLGANTALPTFEGDDAAAQAHAKFLKDKKVRVDIFALREGGVIDGKLLGPLRPEVPTLQAGAEVPGRGRGADARRRPSAHPGDGRFQRDLGRADRPPGRPRDRPVGGHRARRHGRSLLALHQRLHARPQGQPDRPPQPAGHLRPALQQADSARRRPGRPLRPRSPRRPRPGRSRSRRRSTIASSTARTWTTSSARGRGPSCRSS